MYHNQRGSMLIVALMVLVALSGVGIVMVHKINDEIRVTGNGRRGATAFHVTESGAYSSLAYADSLGPSGFLATLESQMLTETDDDGVTTSQVATWQPDQLVDGVEYFDLSADGSFGFEGYLAQGDDEDGSGNPSPSTQAPVTFEIQIRPSGMLQPLVGYAVSGPSARCRFKYQFDADGGVNSNTSPGEPAEATFDAWKRIRALMYVGPLPCDRASGSIGET